MTENKRFHFGYVLGDTGLFDEQSTEHKWFIKNCCSVSDLKKNWKTVCDKLNEVADENEQLKQQINDMSRFEHTGEHIRLSINIETGELQRHIYATGQWFGDFDRVLCENWINKEDYQRFIDRVIEVYNTEFKGDLND